MALLGLGLIAMSFCFFIYKVPPKRWIELLRPRSQDSKNLRIKPREKGADANEDDKAEYDEKQILGNPVELVISGDDVNESTSTPKAQPTAGSGAIPLFSLHPADQTDSTRRIESPPVQSSSNQQSSMPPPSMALHTSRILTSLSSSSSSAPKSASTSSLMPPPSVKPSALRPLPKLSGSLAPPPSAAASLRGQQSRYQSSSSALPIAPSTSTLPPNKRPSRKVLLDPGHSPLDWANLIRAPPTPTFLRGTNVPRQLIQVSPSQLKRQNGRKGMDAWGTYQGKVYNLTPYLKFHPGGEGELLRGAGKVGKAEELFIEIHPWVNWDGMLSECLVGILVSENSDIGAGQQDLEAMD